jgi:hypothetical protein
VEGFWMEKQMELNRCCEMGRGEVNLPNVFDDRQGESRCQSHSRMQSPILLYLSQLKKVIRKTCRSLPCDGCRTINTKSGGFLMFLRVTVRNGNLAGA